MARGKGKKRRKKRGGEGWNEEGRGEKQEVPRRHEVRVLSVGLYYMTQDSHRVQSLKCSVTGHGDFAVHFPAGRCHMVPAGLTESSFPAELERVGKF